jgi:hypothetical protein
VTHHLFVRTVGIASDAGRSSAVATGFKHNPR